MTMHKILTCIEKSGANNGVCPVGFEPLLVTGYIQTETPLFDAGQIQDAFNAGFIVVFSFYVLGLGVGAVIKVFKSTS